MRQLSTRWQGRIPPCFAGVRAGGMIRSHRALHLGISAPLTAHGEARASDTRGGGVRHRDAPLCRFARVEGALQSGGWPLPKSPGRTHARVPRLRRSRTTSAIVPQNGSRPALLDEVRFGRRIVGELPHDLDERSASAVSLAGSFLSHVRCLMVELHPLRATRISLS